VQAWAWWSVRWRLIWWGLIGRALGLVNGGLRVVRGEFDIFGERCRLHVRVWTGWAENLLGKMFLRRRVFVLVDRKLLWRK
jgi:hypothetical protein